jgi:hypothetical protein
LTRPGGAALAQNSGEATGILTYLAGQARAERAEANGMDPLDAVVLADQHIAASDGGGDILTADELARASQLMNGMSAVQAQQFEDLLANAKAPQAGGHSAHPGDRHELSRRASRGSWWRSTSCSTGSGTRSGWRY